MERGRWQVDEQTGEVVQTRTAEELLADRERELEVERAKDLAQRVRPFGAVVR